MTHALYSEAKQKNRPKIKPLFTENLAIAHLGSS